MNNNKEYLSTLILKIENYKLKILQEFLREIGCNKNIFFDYLIYEYMKSFFKKLAGANSDLIHELEEKWFEGGSPNVVHQHLKNLISQQKQQEKQYERTIFK